MNGAETVGQERIILPPGFVLDTPVAQGITPPKGFVLDSPTPKPPAGFVLDVPNQVNEEDVPQTSPSGFPFKQIGRFKVEQVPKDEETARTLINPPNSLIGQIARDAWAEIKTLGGGFYKAAARTASALDFYLNLIGKGLSKVTGIPQDKLRIGLIKELQDNWGYYGNKLSQEGIQVPVLKEIISGLGSAGFDIPMIMATPGPFKLAAHGAVMGGAEGGVTGALKGATSGQIMHGGLGLTSGLRLSQRIPAMFGLGAATTPGGIEERVSGGATLAALSFTGGDLKNIARSNPKMSSVARQEIEKLPDREIYRVTQSEINKITGKEFFGMPEEAPLQPQFDIGIEARGIPTEFQPKPEVEMAFPKSPAEILAEKKAAGMVKAQAQWDELHPLAEVSAAASESGKPITMNLYRGARPKTTEGYGTDAGDLGAGIYWTDHELTAKQYATPVQREQKTFKNPLVLNGEEALNLIAKYKTTKGGQRMEGARALSKWAMSQGHDAIIVKGYDAPPDNFTVVELHPWEVERPGAAITGETPESIALKAGKAPWAFDIARFMEYGPEQREQIENIRGWRVPEKGETPAKYEPTLPAAQPFPFGEKIPGMFPKSGIVPIKDINKFLVQIKPVLDQGWNVTYLSKDFGKSGWAMLESKSDPGKGSFRPLGPKEDLPERIRIWQGRKPAEKVSTGKAPQYPFLNWIRNQGGINLALETEHGMGGELLDIKEFGRKFPGLVNNQRGRTVSQLTELAQQEGADITMDDLNTFIEWARDEIHGTGKHPITRADVDRDMAHQERVSGQRERENTEDQYQDYLMIQFTEDPRHLSLDERIKAKALVDAWEKDNAEKFVDFVTRAAVRREPGYRTKAAPPGDPAGSGAPAEPTRPQPRRITPEMTGLEEMIMADTEAKVAAELKAEEEAQAKAFEEKGAVKPIPSAVKEQKPLFGGEFAPATEKVQPKKAAVLDRTEQPTLFETKVPLETDAQAGFDVRKVRHFADVDEARSKMQPYFDDGWHIKIGPQSDGQGWAQLVEKKAPGEGKAEYVPLPRYQKQEFLGMKPVQKEIVEPEPSQGTIDEALPSAPLPTSFNEELVKTLDKINVPVENRPELAERALRKYDPALGIPLENYLRKTIALTYWTDKRPWTKKRPTMVEKEIQIDETIPLEAAEFQGKVEGPEVNLERRATIDGIKKRIRLNVEEGPNEARDIKILEGSILENKTNEEMARERGMTGERIRQIVSENWTLLKDDPVLKRLLTDLKNMNAPQGEDLRQFYGGYDFVGEVRRTIKAIQEKRALKRAGIPETVPEETAGATPADTAPIEIGVDPSVDPVVQKVMDAIKEARPKRREQQILRSKETGRRLREALAAGKRVGGEQGFYAQLGALKGKYPEVGTEPLKGKLTQGDFDYLHDMIIDSPKLEGFESINAGEAFSDLLQGKIPPPSRAILLEKVFGPEFAKTLVEDPTLFKRITTVGLDLLNLARAYKTSGDVSFSLRQGILMEARHPGIFWKAFPEQFKWLVSEKAFQASQAEIASRPTFDLMKKAGVALTDIGENVRVREEPYQSSIAEKIPGKGKIAAALNKIYLPGKIVHASNRAFTGFANRLRADAFDYLVKSAEARGREPYDDIELAKDIAKVVNVNTARGGLGKLEGAAVALNAGFFAPRNWAARLSVINPRYYVKLDPFARREALTTLLAFTGQTLTVLGLAKLAGVSVGTDLTSADAGKMKLGNTRVDIIAGYQQLIRLTAQLITGKMVSSTTGKTVTLGEGYRPMTRLDILSRAIESKEAPWASFVTGLIRGTNAIGQPFSVGKEVANLFVPMVTQDFLDVAKDNPDLVPMSVLKIMGMTALSAMGVGTQTYGLNNPKDSTGRELDRLRLSMDYLSKPAGKDKIPPGEYDKLSATTKSEISAGFGRAMSRPNWAGMDDENKRKTLEYIARQIKDQVSAKAKTRLGYKSP